jgi:hypothetical protein
MVRPISADILTGTDHEVDEDSLDDPSEHEELRRIDDLEDRGSDYSPTRRRRNSPFDQRSVAFKFFPDRKQVCEPTTLIRGRKKPPRLTRETRSNIRYLSRIGIPDATVAEIFSISLGRVGRASSNGYRVPDNIDSDNDHVTPDILTKYPRKASRLCPVYFGED